MPVLDTPELVLAEALESVKDQTYSNWELCICDDGSTQPAVERVLKIMQNSDARVKATFSKKNQGMSEASNHALDQVTGDFVGFLDQDGLLAPDALSTVVDCLSDDPNMDFFYTDEDKINAKGRHLQPFFKPDWSPHLFLSENYVAHFSVIRKSVIDKVGRFRAGFDGSQDYDLALRVTEVTDRICHIPRLLYSSRKLPAQKAGSGDVDPYAYVAGERALRDALFRRGIEGEVQREGVTGRYRVTYKIIDNPLVSIVIPTRSKKQMLERCISSIMSKTEYRNFELIIVDHQSDDPATREYLTSLKCKLVRYEGVFNFSKICNLGAREAAGEYLVFLNNDTEVIEPGWLNALLEQAQRYGVGAVGAKLVYPDGVVQHAGIIIGFDGFATNYSGFTDGASYHGVADVVRDCSAVTAACMIIPMTLFYELNGFDEEMGRSWQDVDICLRIVESGKRIVYTPRALLYHYEGGTRGKGDVSDEEIKCRDMFRDKHRQYIERGDPYYNPNLALTVADGPYSVIATGNGPLDTLIAVYQARVDLRREMPEAKRGDYRRLLNWAATAGTTTDADRLRLGKFAEYYRRTSLREARIERLFPENTGGGKFIHVVLQSAVIIHREGLRRYVFHVRNKLRRREYTVSLAPWEGSARFSRISEGELKLNTPTSPAKNRRSDSNNEQQQ